MADAAKANPLPSSEGYSWGRIAAATATIGLLLTVALRRVSSLPSGPEVDLSLLVASQLTLWQTKWLPLPLASLGVLLFAHAAGLVPLESVYSGFATDEFFFLVAVFYLSETLKANGTLHKVLLLLLRGRASLSSGVIAWFTPLLILSSASVLPAAGARAAVLKPIFTQLFASSPGGENALRRYTMVLLGNLASIVSRAFLSGGPGVIVIAGILSASGHGISWGLWLRLMGFPVLCIVLLTTALHVIWLKPHRTPPIRLRGEAVSLTAYDWFILIILTILVACWVTEQPFDNVAVPTLLAMILLALPIPGRNPSTRLRNLDWEQLVLAGAMLSIGQVLVSSGTGRYLGEHLLVPLAQISSPTLLIMGLMAVLLVIRLPLLGGGPYSAIALPIALGQAEVLNLSPLTLALLTALAGGITILPMQSHSGLIASQGSEYSFRDSLISGLLLLVAAMIVLFAVATPMWNLS